MDFLHGIPLKWVAKGFGIGYNLDTKQLQLGTWQVGLAKPGNSY